MAIPSRYPFKTVYLDATSTSSNAIASVVAPSRGKLITVWIAPNGTNQTAAAGAVDCTVNGSTASGLGAVAISSGVAGAYSVNASPANATYLVAGDVLATVSSSVVATNTTFVVQEF